MGRVEGKVALVTGAAMGLGLADATMLIEEGARVLLTDVNVEAGQKAADALGENAAFTKLDVSSPEEWAAAISVVEEKFGGLDVLVNNAGIVIVADPESCTYEDFKKTNAIMNDGVFLGMQTALPLLKNSKNGSIINMSSTASHLGYPPFFAYSAAKGAVRSMTKSMAIHCQMANLPVRCVSIHASGIETPMVQTVQGRGDEAPMEIPKDGILPQESLGCPEDVARMVVFLASDDARFLTGSEFIVDNGLLARPADIVQ